MQKFADAFQKKYPEIQIEEDFQTEIIEDEEGNIAEEKVVTYNVTAIPDLTNLTLALRSADDFNSLDRLISASPVLFSNYLGGCFDGVVEVVLTRIGRGITFFVGGLPREISVESAFKGNIITVKLLPRTRKMVTQIGFISSHLVGVRALQSSSAIAIIKGQVASNPQKLESDTADILRSILFDLEYTYGFAFETTNLENLKSARVRTKRRSPPLPSDTIRVPYKAYVPELIEYFHVAERVDYLPFKYICYFHVLEYFMDKSAYSVVSKKIKRLLLSPDFHLRSAEYISNAVNIIKLETERNTTDKIKIGRVISEFAQGDTVQKHLSGIFVLEHFTSDHTLTCAKPLKLSAIRFDSEQSFIESTAKRVYAMRCSIVHSNPDFDESKAVPFLPSLRNIEFLRLEIELIKELSRTIICSSAQ